MGIWKLGLTIFLKFTNRANCQRLKFAREIILLVLRIYKQLNIVLCWLNQQLKQFQKDNEHIGFGSGSRALEQAMEKTKANIKWVAENKIPVNDWFINAVRQSP